MTYLSGPGDSSLGQQLLRSLRCCVRRPADQRRVTAPCLEREARLNGPQAALRAAGRSSDATTAACVPRGAGNSPLALAKGLSNFEHKGAARLCRGCGARSLGRAPTAPSSRRRRPFLRCYGRDLLSRGRQSAPRALAQGKPAHKTEIAQAGAGAAATYSDFAPPRDTRRFSSGKSMSTQREGHARALLTRVPLSPFSVG